MFTIALLVFACTAPKGAEDSAEDSAEDTDRVPETPFDESCFGQVMFTQVVDSNTIAADWSALAADSAGAAFGPSDVELIHWYIFGMPVSTINNALCAADAVSMDNFVTGSVAADVVELGGTSATVELTSPDGDAWNRETGVLALYDEAAADGADIWPRAAAVFTFDADAGNNRVVVEGRGDVYTAP